MPIDIWENGAWTGVGAGAGPSADTIDILSPTGTIYDGDVVVVRPSLNANVGFGVSPTITSLTVSGVAAAARRDGTFAFIASSFASPMTLATSDAVRTITVTARTNVLCPSTIDSTGATDVTSALATWFNGLAAGSRAIFTAISTYRMDHILSLTNLTGVLIDGTNASFFTNDPTGDSSTLSAPSAAARTRAHFRPSNCKNVQLKNIKFTGPNPTVLYVAALEAQHFVDMQPNTTANAGFSIVNCTASNIYGDFMTVGNKSTDVLMQGGTYSVCGRMEVSVTDGQRVAFMGNSFSGGGRTILDLEPNFSTSVIDTVLFDANTIGDHRLNFVSAASSTGSIQNIYITNNTGTTGAANSQIGNASNPTHQANWVFDGNQFPAEWGSSADSGALAFINVNGLTVTNNLITLQAGRGDYAVKASNCTDRTVSGNSYPGGVGELLVVSFFDPVRQHVGTTLSTSGTVIAVTPASNTLSGSTVIVNVHGRATTGRSVSSVADSAGNTYVRDLAYADGSGRLLEIWRCASATSITTAGTITVTLSGTESVGTIVWVDELIPYASALDLAASYTLTSTATSFLGGTPVTTLTAGDLLYQVWAPSGPEQQMTLHAYRSTYFLASTADPNNTGVGQSMICGWRSAPTPAAYSADYCSINRARTGVTAIIALKAA